MGLSDNLLGAAVPIVVGAGYWALKQLIREQSGRQGPKGDRGEPGLGMTVRNFKEFSDFLIIQLNGRYLLANEARAWFKKIDDRIANIETHLLITDNTKINYHDTPKIDD